MMREDRRCRRAAQESGFAVVDQLLKAGAACADDDLTKRHALDARVGEIIDQ